jgi:hypothetical protein
MHHGARLPVGVLVCGRFARRDAYFKRKHRQKAVNLKVQKLKQVRRRVDQRNVA